MTFRPAPHDPRCHGSREYVGPFPITTTHHHPECSNPVDKEMRTR